MMTEEDTEHLLEMINPLYVLSGDDHDVCEYLHDNDANTHEVTVPTFR